MGILSSIFGTVKKFRQSKIEQRERIGRVKKAMTDKEKGTRTTQTNKKAEKLAKEIGVSYLDALEYVKSEEKSAQRKEGLKQWGSRLSRVGAQAQKVGQKGMRGEFTQIQPVSRAQIKPATSRYEKVFGAGMRPSKKPDIMKITKF